MAILSKIILITFITNFHDKLFILVKNTEITNTIQDNICRVISTIANTLSQYLITNRALVMAVILSGLPTNPISLLKKNNFCPIFRKILISSASSSPES